MGLSYYIGEPPSLHMGDARVLLTSSLRRVVQAVRAVLSGEVDRAFAVVRPPGHHAESSEVQGFCFYNNVAVAAHVALQHPGMDRVLVFDWDVSITDVTS